ncbi:hypothetical protein SM124_21095 [Bacillus sp. 31A1R]|uniref:Uncharacterized protein n=1 Tax=Robertmurraya mangrovi TaxID=3098077 RepID=A0ABU5J441_9BACI|nr:hypothetical protein [Bacillus sp. 31A1R]MDZ5474195.1 hypothetical protein [Bacillus sp. 31A1R]
MLISKTGVSSIHYFVMNGKLLENDDLHYEVEIYKNGELTDQKLGSYGEIQKSFKDTLLSFGVNDLTTSSNKHFLDILAGQPGGLMSSSKEHEMTAWGLSSMIDNKVTLVKDEPLYLAAWVGTTKETFQSGYDDIQSMIKNNELTIVYKITLVDS